MYAELNLRNVRKLNKKIIHTLYTYLHLFAKSKKQRRKIIFYSVKLRKSECSNLNLSRRLCLNVSSKLFKERLGANFNLEQKVVKKFASEFGI